MRIRSAITTAALLALVTTGCGSDTDASSSDKPSKAKPPTYSVIKDTDRAVELLVEDATKSSATAAIEDWIDTKVGDRKAVNVQVVRSKDAGTIVCRGEYYADEDTAEIQSGGRIKADEWPHTEIDCPDPGGS